MSKLYKNKFINKRYRVIPKLDIETSSLPTVLNSKGEEVFDKSFDDYYIPCTRGNAEIYYYGKDTTFGGNGRDDILCAVINSYSIGDDVNEKLKDYVISSTNNFTNGVNAPPNKEVTVYFYAKDIDLFAKLLKAGTRGAKSIPPSSKKNLPHEREIDKTVNYKDMPKDWWKEFSAYGNNISKKNHISAKSTWSYIFNEFSNIVKRDIVAEAKSENYKTTHYIHKAGLWEEFSKYMIKEGA